MMVTVSSWRQRWTRCSRKTRLSRLRRSRSRRASFSAATSSSSGAAGAATRTCTRTARGGKPRCMQLGHFQGQEEGSNCRGEGQGQRAVAAADPGQDPCQTWLRRCANPAPRMPNPFLCVLTARAETPLVKLRSEAKDFFDASKPTDVFNGITGELLSAAAGASAAACTGRLHESMHGRHVGSACAAVGSTRPNPVNPVAAG